MRKQLLVRPVFLFVKSSISFTSSTRSPAHSHSAQGRTSAAAGRRADFVAPHLLEELPLPR
jgi:hypothetical protein